MTQGRSAPAEVDALIPVGARIVETSRLALALDQQGGLLVVLSKRPRTGSIIFDASDLSAAAWEVLRLFVASAGGSG